MYHAFSKYVAIAVAALFLAACAGTKDKADEMMEPAVVDQSMPSGTGAEGSTTGLEGQTGFQGHPLDDPDSLLSERVVYFDFDKSDVRPEDHSVIEAHAQYLASHPSAAVTVEGHADERGSREYNIALGERRANSVRNLMTLMGASGQQIRTVSYGEERPAAMGHDESSWSLNRRAEIVYLSR